MAEASPLRLEIDLEERPSEDDTPSPTFSGALKTPPIPVVSYILKFLQNREAVLGVCTPDHGIRISARGGREKERRHATRLSDAERSITQVLLKYYSYPKKY